MASESAAVVALASTLLALSEGESVRAIEALAATLVNRRRAGKDRLPNGDLEAPGLHETGPIWRGPAEAREAVCHRVARRALSRVLRDPTQGATAFHHIDAMPAWARDRSPVAVYGRYLFYRLETAA